jgi:hypothetical protein
MTEQQALDHIYPYIKKFYREWYIVLAQIPQWEEVVDLEVQKYIQACQNVVIANVNYR